MIRIDHLHPIERGGGIPDLANAAVIASLAPADTAEVEPHHRAAQPLEGLIHSIGDPVIHRSPMQRMRMKNQRPRRTSLLRVVVTTLKPTVRAGKHHLWHGVPKPLSYSCRAVSGWASS